MKMGSLFFTIKRYWEWRFSSRSFACRYDPDPVGYPHRCFFHQTPLFRRLANSEMWMQQNKVINLKLAAARLNGIVLHPGETLSFWRLVGKPTRRRGYQEGMVLCEGWVVPGVGVGLCQLSNLIYWMVLHTELTVGERWRHNYDVFPDTGRTQPFGSGATVSYNYVDLQIRNETGNTYQLHLWLTETDLCGEWRSLRPPNYSFEVYEKEHLITHEPWGGYVRHNLIQRRVYTNLGEQVGDELVAENHAIMMYQPFLTAAN
jgi:vancomycin resistance protein VanW